MTSDPLPDPPSFEFEGRRVPVFPGDTIASALYRTGVRTFSRSFKYHRRRGLYCLTGDCPNCLMTVDGEPAVGTCRTPAEGIRRVARGNGWPSADFDVAGVLWHLRALLPVGFYYKAMIRPRWLWPIAERLVRRLAGLGPVPRDLPPTDRERMSHHPDLLVIGGGLAGLSAALAAAERGERVLLAEEAAIGETIPPGVVRARLEALRTSVTAHPRITVLERATAVGIYQGPLVPVVGRDALHLVQPARIVVATGAVERHAVFRGSDLPGVWLGRGAARLAGVHRLAPGRRIVVVATADEGLGHLELIQASTKPGDSSPVVAAIVPDALAGRVPRGIEVIAGGMVERAVGRRRLSGVVVAVGGSRRALRCDALVLSLGLQPRDGLLRQAATEPVVGAGDVVHPGCTPAEAEASGREAGLAGLVPRAVEKGGGDTLPTAAEAGFVCLCEDVGVEELEDAWREGYRSTELLKRYTTVTMGACQGALCHPHLRAFACARSPEPRLGTATTARPPARPVRLEDLAAGARVPVEYRTPLHDRHLQRGAVMEWAGVWKRPERYGNPEAEYWAVRTGVSVMDLSTLGKYRVAGPGATEFLERLYPCRVADLGSGRSRYAPLLNEAGYIVDDGLVCSLGGGTYYLTFTSAGGDWAEAWMREWAETWGLQVRVANQTASRSAINVAGPRARELLARLSDGPVGAEAIPYGGVREIAVAGVPCLALRVGFVGELSYELHHPSRRSEALWDALHDAGAALGLVPHGLEALRLLRLEKGHIIVGQDTDFDTSPSKVGLDWTVKLDKPDFVGATALRRLALIPRERSLLAVTFAGPSAPAEGAQLFVGDEPVGYLTSSRFSPVLAQGIALGWVRHPPGVPPRTVLARDGAGEFAGIVTRGPFYDPRGERLRA